jgi:hypothetical protein
MDYKQTNTTAVSLIATVDKLTYRLSYSYDVKGNITGISGSISKEVDNSTTQGEKDIIQVGSMSINDYNGYVDMNIAGTEDLALHATNIATLLTKIKADVAAAIETTDATSK